MIRILHIPSGNYVKFYYYTDEKEKEIGIKMLISEDLSLWPTSYPEHPTVEEAFNFFTAHLLSYHRQFWETSKIDYVDHFPEEFEIIYD